MRPLLAVALLVGFAPAAPVPKELKAKKDDRERMVGRWVAAHKNSHSFEYFDDGTMRVWDGPDPGNGGGARYKWSLDPTASPKRMTWYGVGATTPQFECVYELDGDDLKLNYTSAPAVPQGVGPANGSYHAMTRQPAK